MLCKLLMQTLQFANVSWCACGMSHIAMSAKLLLQVDAVCFCLKVDMI